MNDLERIANLEFAKVVKRLSNEKRQSLQNAMAGKPRGGASDHAKLQVELDYAERMCREFGQIWLDLLEARNGGQLTRQNVVFIIQKVTSVAAARKGSIGNEFPGRTSGVNSEVGRRMDSIVAAIRNDLDLKLLRQQAFPPKKEVTSEKSLQPVNITIHNAANVNLGLQIGTVNAALHAVSEQGESHKEIASVLKQFTHAVIEDKKIREEEKRETLEVVEDIAKEAKAKPESRSLAKLKVMVAGLHALVGTSNDLSELWSTYSPAVRHFFKI